MTTPSAWSKLDPDTREAICAQVLKLRTSGLTFHQIARHVGVSPKTITAIVRNIRTSDQVVDLCAPAARELTLRRRPGTPPPHWRALSPSEQHSLHTFILHMYEQGCSILQISKIVAIGRRKVTQLVACPPSSHTPAAPKSPDPVTDTALGPDEHSELCDDEHRCELAAAIDARLAAELAGVPHAQRKQRIAEQLRPRSGARTTVTRILVDPATTDPRYRKALGIVSLWIEAMIR